jgi:hypothetical protein
MAFMAKDRTILTNPLRLTLLATVKIGHFSHLPKVSIAIDIYLNRDALYFDQLSSKEPYSLFN